MEDVSEVDKVDVCRRAVGIDCFVYKEDSDANDISFRMGNDTSISKSSSSM